MATIDNVGQSVIAAAPDAKRSATLISSDDISSVDGHPAASTSDELIASRFQKVSAELVELTRQLIDPDEAVAAHHEALSIAEELKKHEADETIVTRKSKGFVSRLSLTFSGTADLASKGELINPFSERLNVWLLVLSDWSEWHARRYPPTDPCA